MACFREAVLLRLVTGLVDCLTMVGSPRREPQVASVIVMLVTGRARRHHLGSSVIFPGRAIVFRIACQGPVARGLRSGDRVAACPN
ncbi:hypothetical protein B0H21DRAFT_760104, partial [Amylocystis lapponica]